MKKICIIIIFIFGLFFQLEMPLQSMEMIIGAKIWYVTWLPWLRDAGQTAEDRYFGFQNTKDGGGWMYGGNAAVRISSDISISVSYLYGVLGSDFEVSNREIVQGDDLQYQQRGHTSIYRHDVDSAISYSFTDMLRIFAGYKYQPIKSKLRSVGAEHNYTSPGNDYYSRISMNMEVQNHCPALGVGFVFPFENIFVFSVNASALYLFGSMDYSHTQIKYPSADLSNPETPSTVKGKMDLTGWGCNIEPAILVVVKENILLSLGFRWQMAVMKGVYKGENANITYSNMYDYVYGAFLNVMYRFN